MNHDFDDERLSAYLDDELSVAERADVERLLAERPEARRLLEELRALRDDLRALPKLQLGDDFGTGVLRHAERELLRPAPSNGTVAPARPAGGGPALDESGGRWRRPAAWSILAVAAALVVMFFESRRGEEQQVALHRVEESSIGPANAAQKTAAPATPLPKQDVATKPEAEIVGGQFVVSNSIPPMNAVAGSPPTPPAAAAPPAQAGGRYAIVDAVPQSKPTSTEVLNNLQIAGTAVESQVPAAAMPSKIGPAIAPIAVGAANAFNMQGVDTTPLVASNDYRRAQTLISEYSGVRQTAPDAKQATQLFSQRVQQRARDEQGRPGDDRVAGLRGREQQPADDDRLLVVYCDVTPEALERGLPQVLQREQIADLTALQQMAVPATSALALGGGVGGGGGFGGLGLGGAAPAPNSDKQVERKNSDHKDADQSTSQEQYLYVVADGRRLESMLSSLRNEPQFFVNVEVEPAANVQQQPWRKYNRAADVAQAKPKEAGPPPAATAAASLTADAPSAAAAKPAAPGPTTSPVPGAAPSAVSAPLAARGSAAGEKGVPIGAAMNRNQRADAPQELSKSAAGGAGTTRGVQGLRESLGAATSGGGGVAPQPIAEPSGAPQQPIANGAYGGASGYAYAPQLVLPLSRAQRLSSVNVESLGRGLEAAKKESVDGAAGALAKTQSPSAADSAQPSAPTLGDGKSATAPPAARLPMNEAKRAEEANRPQSVTTAQPTATLSLGSQQKVTPPAMNAPVQSFDAATPGDAGWYGLPADYHEALFIFRVVDRPAK